MEGPAGTGKTTVGVGRLLRLLQSGIPARSIAVFTPQRTLATPYYEAANSPAAEPGGSVTFVTLGSLAQRMVDLFWPLIVEDAGFGHPRRPPTFLTLETAQYYMAEVLRPLLDEGFFESVTIDRNRLYSQIIDNLNKAAVVGFSHTEIGDRLKSAWGGEQSQKRIYDEAQVCATHFRRTCLAHNLLDFSLQVEVFLEHLWTRPICRDYLVDRFRHLIADNVEEDVPVAHDLLREWISCAASAMVIYDTAAGYRRFLGADPESAHRLRELCSHQVALEESFVTRPEMEALGAALTRSVNHLTPLPGQSRDAREALTFDSHRYHPQMLDWVADEVEKLVHQEDVPPHQIVLLAPFLSDALRFSLNSRLERRGVPTHSHRPSRALRDEPATHCLLTLAAIAHPAWGLQPTHFDVAYALMQAIEGMDLVRAQLLAQIVYRVVDGVPHFSSFDAIKPDMQERLTFVLGERYESLRLWLEEVASSETFSAKTKGSLPPTLPRRDEDFADAGTSVTSSTTLEQEPFDYFLSRLFGEVLSQPGYGFHRDFDAAEVAANLIESVRKFRWVTEGTRSAPSRSVGVPETLGREYAQMVEEGVIAAQYVRSWQLGSESAVLLAPAYTFIIRNRPVDYQFWLDIGGSGWWERLYQPLTHPYVLSRHWPPADRENPTWTDSDEVEAREKTLRRLTLGLIRRCRRQIYLGSSELGEQGYEQKGPLLQAIQHVLRGLSTKLED